jgi:hypothetical protein
MKRGAKAAAPIPQTDVDIAVDLHRLVASNAPRPTLVESIPEQYMQMYWKPFPIPPEAVPPGGLPDILARDFGHIFQFTRSRSGESLVTTALPPETPLDHVALFHMETMRARLPPGAPPRPPIASVAANAPPPTKKAKASPKQGPKSKAPSAAGPTKLSPEQEQSAQLLMRALHQVLLANPSYGEASSYADLRGKLQDGFYELFELPLLLSTGESVDPIELVQRGQGKAFSRILEDPLSGSVVVKSLSENPQFPSVGSLNFAWSTLPSPPPPQAAKQTPPPEDVIVLALRLKELLLDNLRRVDQAIDNPPSNPANIGLWKQAFEALCGQESQSSQILQSIVSL